MNRENPIEPPQLIAHRGYALHYPENSIEGISAALDAGAQYVEFDVHLSADEVAVVIHDAQLFRTTGQLGLVYETPLNKLRKLDANEPNRFRNRIRGIQIPTLQEMVSLLQGWPEVTPLIELKRASLNYFGRAKMVAQVMHDIQPILEQAMIISFDAESLLESRQQGAKRIGWVIETWNEEAHLTAQAMQPEYLICNHTKLPEPPTALWPGPWQWAVYDTADAELALQLAQRNISLIETMAIGEMLADPRLKPGG
ncbi:MAG: hypothetical protein L3J28_12360 [Candidatus Polarisedimenticolaceae bacterium]|nr:hypothetical protein [Candidatus Polarisedimenticolaceae bacterium]